VLPFFDASPSGIMEKRMIPCPEQRIKDGDHKEKLIEKTAME